MEYGQGIELLLPYSEAVQAVKAALKEQGFGVLTEIDVKATMREKIDRDIEDYVILGACNPHLASQALDVDRRIGLLLPCNVVVRDGGNGRTVVEVLDPHVMVAVPRAGRANTGRGRGRASAVCRAQRAVGGQPSGNRRVNAAFDRGRPTRWARPRRTRGRTPARHQPRSAIPGEGSPVTARQPTGRSRPCRGGHR